MRITVFTSTYNRRHMITKLYSSLKKQNFNDFEWLIIDDGSTDNTKELFNQWECDEKNFVVRYIYSENKGKMMQMNKAMELADGELFFTVDSDDELTPDALEKIDKWEKTIVNKEAYCGIAPNSGTNSFFTNNQILPGEFYDTTLFSRLRGETEICIGADRAWVFYTEVYKKYKFPEFPGEKFIPEAVVWNRMANNGLKIRCFNDIVYLYEQQVGGYTDTMSNTLINSPRGYGIWKSEMMTFLNYPLRKRIKEYYIFYCDLKSRHTMRNIAEYIHCPLYIMFFIAGVHWIKNRGG